MSEEPISLQELNVQPGEVLVMVGYNGAPPKAWQAHWRASFEANGILAQDADATLVSFKEQRSQAYESKSKIALLAQNKPGHRGTEGLPFELILMADYVLCLGEDGRGTVWKNRRGPQGQVVRP